MNGSRTFRMAATGARILTGAVVAAACVVGVVVAIPAAWPTIEHEPAQADVTPLPGDTVLVCNGDFRAIGRTPSDPLQMVSAASPELTVDGSSGAPTADALTVGDLTEGTGPDRLVGEVEGRTAPLIGATESVSLAVSDLAGLAAAPCRPASTESWLVGGSVATGTEDLIILTNPGEVPSTVSLAVFGSTRSSTSVIVPAGAQIGLPLSSIASGAEAPVVKLTATGAPVRAVLQSSLTRTLDPAGIDLQDAVAAPQLHPVIPGVQVIQSPDDGADAVVLRLLSPGANAEAVVTARALGDTSASSEFTFPLTADEPTQVSLATLEPGTYTVHVDSDTPVLAAVREQDGAGPSTDFTWLTPAPEITDEVLVSVPAGPEARLVLANDDDADAVVTVEATDGGAPQEVRVPAGSSAALDVDPQTVYSLRTTTPVHATVSMIAPGALAAWPVWPAVGAQQSITVYP